MKKYWICVLFLLLILHPVHSYARNEDSTKIQNLEVGQMLMVGISGTKFSQITKRKIFDLRPGGIILFSRNISSAEQLAKLTYDLQSYARSIGLPPLFIAIDQEGGSVTRLKSWPPLPSAAAIGISNDENLAFKLSFFTGQVMQTLGLNMNLAPVLDLAEGDGPSFLGSRSYSEDPKIVERMGRATLLGYKTAGILPVAKHYPGHGAAHGDSHQILPSSSLNKAHMYSSHLRPYIKPIAQNTLNAVMAAHVSFPKLDSSGLPATFSRVILTDQLRHDLGFNGLIMTDDVEMQAAKRFKTAESRTLQSINAGADIVMIAWNMKSQYQAKAALVSALKSGQLSKERVNESLIRISAAKENITVNDKPTRAEIRSLVYHRELYRAIEGIQVGRGPAGKQNASKIRQ